jgi:hypothetical protein
MSIGRRHYQAMTSEDVEDFVCALITLIFRISENVIVTCSEGSEAFSKSICQPRHHVWSLTHDSNF